MNKKEILAKIADGLAITQAEKDFMAKSDATAEEKETVESADVETAENDEVSDELMEKFMKSEIGKKFDAVATRVAEKNAKAIEDARGTVVNTEKSAVEVAKNNKETASFIKALVAGDVQAIKAMTTSRTDTAKGGYTIPEVLETEILRIVEDQYGIARQEMRYMKLSSNEVKLTTGGAISTYWTGEGAKKTSDQATFGIATLALKKLASIVPLTDELLEDSAIDLTAYVADLFAESIAKQEDLAFFNGDGTVFTGVFQDTNTESITGALTSDNLIDLQNEVPASAENKWFMHRSVASKIKQLKTGSVYDFPEFRKDGKTLLDSEVVLVEAGNAYSDVTATGDAFLCFGNLKKGAIYGERSGIAMKVSSEATIRNVANDADIHLYEQDMTAIRAVKRTGYVLAVPALIARLLKA